MDEFRPATSLPVDAPDFSKADPITTVVETDAQDGTKTLSPGSTLQRFRYESYEAHISTVPLPAPETLARLKELYPDAPKIIFNQMVAQAKHRTEIEAATIETKNILAKRGQWIAAALGLVGLVGSLIVIDRNHDWGGVAIGGGTLAGLVGLFLSGQSSQRKHLQTNAGVRRQIAEGRPIEEVEGPSATVPTKTHQG